MSAATTLQAAIAAKLAAAFTATVGNGSATTFPLAHNFGTRALYLDVKQGGTPLINGTHYTIALDDANNATLTALGGAPAAGAWAVSMALLRKPVPVVAFKSRDMAAKVEAAARSREIALYVWPSLPKRTMQGVPFVFVEQAEVRVTIVEQPEVNKVGADAYDMIDDVMHALHWQTFAGFNLAHPLQLAATPAEMIWNPATRMDGLAANTRMIDVIFEATYGLQPATSQTT